MTSMLLLFGLFLSRPMIAEYAERRARESYLRTMGRLSAQMAHDVRNPLAVILSAAEALAARQRAASSGEVSEYVEVIRDEARRLEAVITDYQRLGKCEVKRELIHVHQLVDPFANGRPFGVDVDIEADVRWLRLDPELVRVALENLVRNSFEAEPRPSRVTLRARRVRPGDVMFEVADDGPGIEAAHREEVFDDFFTTKASGSGLGLPFARRVAEAHGGRISLASTPGEGTTVRLFLPDSEHVIDGQIEADRLLGR
ncbi:MAG: hypothetical protein HC923_10850 [Myxococcales bacterium]|nr:hypothetical protein [Myxococcales bacterium]